MNIYEKLKEAMKTAEVDKPVTLVEAKKGYRICIVENGDVHYIPDVQVTKEANKWET